jgi:hypothetical protein
VPKGTQIAFIYTTLKFHKVRAISCGSAYPKQGKSDLSELVGFRQATSGMVVFAKN